MFVGPRIATDGLVIALDAGNPKSYTGTGSILYDLTGNSRNAILENGPLYKNNYISFDGIDDYATFSAEYSFTTGNGTDYSLEIWFKMRELPITTRSSNGHIWGGEMNNDVVMYLDPQVNGESRGIIVYDDTAYTETMKTIGKFKRNQWAQWVVTGNGTNNTITHYINGQLDRGPIGVLPETEFNTSWSGTRFAYDSRWGNYSKLDLAIARQYNRELTPDEVLQNYNANKLRFLNIITEGLVLHLDAGDLISYPGTGSTWFDLSGNNYNATLYNGPIFSTENEGIIKLDGIDDYIELPTDSGRNNTIKNSTFTIVFSDSRLTTSPGISTYLYSMSSVFSCLWKRDSETTHYIRVNNVTFPDIDLGTINEDIIYLTLVIDENYLTKFYVNGTLRNTYDYSGSAIDYLWNSDLELGRRRNFEEGPYDEFDYHMVSLYDRALSESEVLQNYNAIKWRFN